MFEIFFYSKPKKIYAINLKIPIFYLKNGKKKKVFQTLVFWRYGGHRIPPACDGGHKSHRRPTPSSFSLFLSLSFSPPLSSFPCFFSWVLVINTKFPKFSKVLLYIFSFFIIFLLFKLCPFLLKLLLLIF